MMTVIIPHKLVLFVYSNHTIPEYSLHNNKNDKIFSFLFFFLNDNANSRVMHM